MLSLDQQTAANSDDTRSLVDCIPDARSADGLSTLECDLMRSSLAEVLRTNLDEAELAVISGRFGLDGNGRGSVAEVAERLGETGAWVSKVEYRALSKLRRRRQVKATLASRGISPAAEFDA